MCNLVAEDDLTGDPGIAFFVIRTGRKTLALNYRIRICLPYHLVHCSSPFSGYDSADGADQTSALSNLERDHAHEKEAGPAEVIAADGDPAIRPVPSVGRLSEVEPVE